MVDSWCVHTFTPPKSLNFVKISPNLSSYGLVLGLRPPRLFGSLRSPATAVSSPSHLRTIYEPPPKGERFFNTWRSLKLPPHAVAVVGLRPSSSSLGIVLGRAKRQSRAEASFLLLGLRPCCNPSQISLKSHTHPHNTTQHNTTQHNNHSPPKSPPLIIIKLSHSSLLLSPSPQKTLSSPLSPETLSLFSSSPLSKIYSLISFQPLIFLFYSSLTSPSSSLSSPFFLFLFYF